MDFEFIFMLSWLEINLGAIAHNIGVIRSELLPETKIMAVIKSNAYGHGLLEVGRTAWTAGAEYLAVDTTDEAIALKLSKIKVPILIMGWVEPKDLERAIQLGIRLTVFAQEQVKPLIEATKRLSRPLKVHLKIDTGLKRLGIAPSEVFEVMEKLSHSPYISIEWLCSHFGDAGDRASRTAQFKILQSILFEFQRKNIPFLPVHMANSEAIFFFKEAHFEMVRPGLAIYGLGGFSQELRPTLSFKTKIVQVKRLRPGERVGYKFTYETPKTAEIAVLPVGYAQGYPRSLSNKAEVLLKGRRCPVRGLICMGMLMVETTGLKAKVGDEVTLLGEARGDRIKAEELAELAGTVPHEIIARLPKELPREYKS